MHGVDLRIPPNASFCTAETRRKTMQEVINILGSLNEWLMWANLAAICMLGWSIQRLAQKIQSIDHDIDYLDRGVERISDVVAKMGKQVYGKKKL